MTILMMMWMVSGMSKCIMVIVIILFAAAVFSETIRERVDNVQQRICELPQKKAALASKTYSGTFCDILEQRIRDLNEVIVEAQQVLAEVNDICVDTNTSQPPKFKLIMTVKQKADVNDIKVKEKNNEFLNAVNDAISDPNIIDPNEIAQGQELFQWCVEILNSEGGL